MTEASTPLGRILSAYVGACLTTPGGDLQTQITHQARRLLDEGHSEFAIAAGAAECGAKGWRYLDRAMQSVSNRQRPPAGVRHNGDSRRWNCRRCYGDMWLLAIHDDGTSTIVGKCDHSPLTLDEMAEREADQLEIRRNRDASRIHAFRAGKVPA